MHKVYTLANLGQSLDLEKPARLAVIGHPVSHSASPQLHQPALNADHIHASYIRLEVAPGELRTAFRKMREMAFIGCNVTVPHKFEAMANCDVVSEQAKILGAVNTVVFEENGTYGYNTDGPGIREAIHEVFGLELGKIHTLILGAGGGAGQAIATQCALEKPSTITLVNRSLDKIIDLARRLKSISPESKIHTLAFNDPSLKSRCHAADLLIQTTSVGLKESDPQVISEDCFLPHHCAYDTIYQPSETLFLAAAKRAGCQTDNGLSLLIHQGAIAYQHWFPGSAPLPYMRAAMKR